MQLFNKEISKARVRRIARGNVSLQRGKFLSQEEWEIKKAQHPEKLKKLTEFFTSKSS